MLASPTTPDRPLYTAPAGPAEADVFATEKRQVEFSLEKLREGRFSLFTRFLSGVLGVGVDVGLEVGRRLVNTPLWLPFCVKAERVLTLGSVA